MKLTIVECTTCRYWFKAKAEDYFASGFQPSSAVDETSFYLICTELLDECWHFHQKKAKYFNEQSCRNYSGTLR